jgi:hypothetical protein
VNLPAESTRVLRAFVYLRAMTFVNALRGWLRRLREPRYLLGALVVGGYLGMVLLGSMHDLRGFGVQLPPEWTALVTAVAACGVAVTVVTAWLLPGDRAALAFSEAEVAFLFPAPLTRVALINFSLLRSQVAILLSAFLLAIVLGRGRGLPGSAWQHAIALWLVMATLRLHILAASFAHERLFGAAAQPWLRRLAGAVVLLAIVGAGVAWLAAHATPPREQDLASPVAFARWLAPWLQAPAVHLFLTPFRWLVAPLFAGGGRGWWASLLPATALLVAHYLWVVRSHVAFEEASIEQAARRAAQVRAMREGRLSLRLGAASARPAPFALAPRGAAPVAFLWKGLIAAGPAARPRNAAIAAVALAALLFALAQSPWREVVGAVGTMLFAFALMLPVFGPMIAQRQLRETLDTLDIYKAAPVRGAHVAFGQLLTPVVLITAAQWWLLALWMVAGLALGIAPWAHGAYPALGVLCVVLLTPPLAMLMLSLPFAGVLWFPAWAPAFSARGGGFEVVGQRMLFGFVFMLVIGFALLPAGAVVAGAWLAGGAVGWPLAGLLAGILLATAIVAGEAALALRLLGRRIDRFDLSLE